MAGQQSGPLGHRWQDPRHERGDWHPTRPADTERPAAQPGTGRPWSGARFGGDR